MCYLIGTDEAGYGPNLGPLVITATVWHVDSDDVFDLYERLQHVLTSELPGRRPAAGGNAGAAPVADQDSWAGPAGRLAIADSKLLYKSGEGLDHLERGVLAMLRLLGWRPRSWGALFEKLLDGQSLDDLCAEPWHRDYELALPVDLDAAELEALVARLRPGLAAAGVRLVAVRSATLFPHRFNQLMAEFGNKAEVLSRTTLRLVAESLAACQGAAVLAICDKHGGRNRYGPLLQRQFPDPLVEVHGESTALSVYRWTDAGRRVEVRFQAGGEAWLPAALASMVSKYLRELAMRAFNEFWCAHVPELRPTAGYPHDAHRFRRDIAEKQLSLGIADRVLWRER